MHLTILSRNKMSISDEMLFGHLFLLGMDIRMVSSLNSVAFMVRDVLFYVET